MRVPNGIHPKWYALFPEGKYYKDDGRTDEEFWAEHDSLMMRDLAQWGDGGRRETPEELRDRVLREMGF